MNHLNATAMQFEKLVLRMMPSCFSSIPEGRLVAGIFCKAWTDAGEDSTRQFFLNDKGGSAFYCGLVGLNHSQIKSIFEKHCKAYKTHLEELAL